MSVARSARLAAFAIVAACHSPLAVTDPVSTDFSARLDQLWDFNSPAESERRFRDELARHAPGSREASETATQIARTQSLRRAFADADATLEGIVPQLGAVPPRVRVRYLLERGRARNSDGDQAAATVLFKEALAASAGDRLAEADFYRVDALHMLGIAAPADQRLDWNRKALAAAEGAPGARARGWAASLNNNIGWAYFERGEPAVALTYWEKALAQREAAGKAATIRVAKWTVARGYRALGKLDDAQAIQLVLVAETEREQAPDGYVYEELAEIALARGNAAAAAPWAAKAHALLKYDAYLAQSEAARLARLAELARGTSQ